MKLGRTSIIFLFIVLSFISCEGVWINEFHYDNSGVDVGEFIEVAGSAGQSLSEWKLILYNGNDGELYSQKDLSGTIPNQGNGFGTASFDFVQIQNGGPDGICLIYKDSVVQFLSYEGTFTASNGPCDGTTSVDIGVTESSSTPAGYSLQLSGLGCSGDNFFWQAPQQETPGLINTGQKFFSMCDLGATVAANTLGITANTQNININSGNIGTNSGHIGTNSGNILTNSLAAATNSENILANTVSVGTNADDINANSANIATNHANIAKNTDNIVINTYYSSTHKEHIATNSANIAANTNDIALVSNTNTINEAKFEAKFTATINSLKAHVHQLEMKLEQMVPQNIYKPQQQNQMYKRTQVPSYNNEPYRPNNDDAYVSDVQQEPSYNNVRYQADDSYVSDHDGRSSQKRTSHKAKKGKKRQGKTRGKARQHRTRQGY